jgi:hypothetical protein
MTPMTCQILEYELTQRLAEREALREQVRQRIWAAEQGEAPKTDEAEDVRLAEQIAALSGRISYLRCMR